MSLITYKCPNCGGDLSLNTETKNWKCEYCHSVFYIDEKKPMEEETASDIEDLQDEVLKEVVIEQEKLDDTEFVKKSRTYNCESCGTTIVTDDTTAVDCCYYCHSKDIIPGQIPDEYRPTKAIPFKLSKDEAIEIFSQWCKKRRFVPSSITSKTQLLNMSGIYIPFWLFNIDVGGIISADAKKMNTWINDNKRYTQNECYAVSRKVKAQFKDINIDGSQKFDIQVMDQLEPYDYSQLEQFSMNHLRGYLAEVSDVDYKEEYKRISQELLEHTHKLMDDTISGYDSVELKRCSPRIDRVKLNCILLPVWAFTYRHNGIIHMVAINGQTGKLTGSLPNSKVKLFTWFILSSGIVFTALWFGGGLI